MNVFKKIVDRDKAEEYQVYRKLKTICAGTLGEIQNIQVMKELIEKYGSDYVARHLIIFSMKYQESIYIDKLSAIFSRAMDIVRVVDIISSATEIYEGSSSIRHIVNTDLYS